jgi:hypothetical protein
MKLNIKFSFFLKFGRFLFATTINYCEKKGKTFSGKRYATALAWAWAHFWATQHF